MPVGIHHPPWASAAAAIPGILGRGRVVLRMSMPIGALVEVHLAGRRREARVGEGLHGDVDAEVVARVHVRVRLVRVCGVAVRGGVLGGVLGWVGVGARLECRV